MPEKMLVIEHSEEFDRAADDLDAFILTLSLPRDFHNKLIELMAKQVNIAEMSAFIQGGRAALALIDLDKCCPK